MQACLHALPHDMPSDGASTDAPLLAPPLQLGLWALVLLLAVLSYWTHLG